MKTIKKIYVLSVLSALVLANLANAADQVNKSFDLQLKDDGTITTPVFDLPFSSFASDEAKAATVKRMRSKMPTVLDIKNVRSMMDEQVAPVITRAASLYPYKSDRSKIGNVPVETFWPANGVAEENQNRILIQLHGGGFVAGGGGPGGALESIPVVGVGRYKVVAVDYRLGPENRFPSASEDVATVYKELLKTYRPENIGIYGCSAGGMLAGESVVWFLQNGLPLPGAIGVFCASLFSFEEGDSAQLWPRMGSVLPSVPPAKPSKVFSAHAPYFAGVSSSDPLAIPGASQAILKQFPPTLFLTGTRAPEMSGAASSHLKLQLLGVKSDLILFDGMDHGFFMDPDLPESKQAYVLISQFFAANLGSAKK
jgi:acetyl esterase/lipase